MSNINKMSIEYQHIFLAPRKDLGVGGWGRDNPFGVRILNPLEIIGQSLNHINNNIFINRYGYLLHLMTNRFS